MDGLGYDGYQFQGKMGDTPIDNRVMITNPDVMTTLGENEAVKQAVPQMTPEMQETASQESAKPENSRAYSEPDMRAVQAKAIENTLNVDKTKLTPEQTAEVQNAQKLLKEQASLPGNADTGSVLQSIDEEYQNDLNQAKAAKMLADCMSEMVV